MRRVEEKLVLLPVRAEGKNQCVFMWVIGYVNVEGDREDRKDYRSVEDESSFSDRRIK
jgi:hypothetical protein